MVLADRGFRLSEDITLHGASLEYQPLHKEDNSYRKKMLKNKKTLQGSHSR